MIVFLEGTVDKSRRENVHAGHRQRLKARFQREGLGGFEEHTLLELLLFFGIPFKDTNVTAHELLLRFGSLSGVFDAQYEQLMSVDGIGENAATLLKLIPEISRRYLQQIEQGEGRYDNIEKLGRMLVSRYRGISTETVFLVLLDNSYKLISIEKIHDGSVNSAQISSRKLAETALVNRASMVVLTHNHPGGIAIPSFDDLQTTAALSDMFDTIGAPMLEHILIAGDSFTPIMYDKLGEKRFVPDYSLLSSKQDLRAFYMGGK